LIYDSDLNNLEIMAEKKKPKQEASSKPAADPCWDGYEKVGMKIKNQKKVPNCVPVKKKP
jgi:hypothetical protein